jgi:hypothetical protein
VGSVVGDGEKRGISYGRLRGGTKFLRGGLSCGSSL